MNIVCCHQFGPPQTLERIEVDAPIPGANEVLITVGAAGVGHNGVDHDVHNLP